MYDSKLSSLCTFDDVALWLSYKRCKNQKGRLWVNEKPILEVIFVTFTENSSCRKRWYSGTSGISILPKTAVRTHFLVARHGTRMIPVFLTADGAVFSIWKPPWVLQKARMKIVVRAIYTYRFFLLHTLSSSAGK